MKSVFVEGSYSHTLNIPDEWEFSKLKNVINLIGGSQPPKSKFFYEEGENRIRLIQIRDYKSDQYKVFIDKADAKRFVDKTDVMIGRYGPPIFQILQGLEGAYNVALMKAEPIGNIFNKAYLYYYLSNQDIYNYVESASDRTAGQSGVNKEHLEKYPVPVVPLAEQQVIADKLDTLLAQVESIKARLERIPEILKQFRQSVLAAAVSGKLTEEWREEEQLANWATTTLDSLILESANGLSKRTGVSGDEVTILRLADFKDAVRVHGNERVIKLDEKEKKKYALEKGDILIIRVNGSVDLAGRFIEYTQYDKMEGFCDHFIRIRLDTSRVNSTYLTYVANHGDGRHYLKNSLSTSAGQNTINQGSIKGLKLLLPSIQEQELVVSRVSYLFKYTVVIEEQVQSALDRVNNLTQSILAKAFRGELTAEWREANPELISGENSAEALLKRIKAERESAKPTTKRGRAKT